MGTSYLEVQVQTNTACPTPQKCPSWERREGRCRGEAGSWNSPPQESNNVDLDKDPRGNTPRSLSANPRRWSWTQRASWAMGSSQLKQHWCLFGSCWEDGTVAIPNLPWQMQKAGQQYTNIAALLQDNLDPCSSADSSLLKPSRVGTCLPKLPLPGLWV